MPADSTPAAGIPHSTDLLDQINDLCEAYAKARVARALAEHSTDHAEHERHASLADYWDRESRTRYDTLAPVIETVAARPVQIETFLPVRTKANGHVEINARDQHSRPVVLTFTGGEAVSIAIHLTAHAAIGLDRTGTKVDPLLPPLPATPAPVAATGRAPVPNPR